MGTTNSVPPNLDGNKGKLSSFSNIDNALIFVVMTTHYSII